MNILETIFFEYNTNHDLIRVTMQNDTPLGVLGNGRLSSDIIVMILTYVLLLQTEGNNWPATCNLWYKALLQARGGHAISLIAKEMIESPRQFLPQFDAVVVNMAKMFIRDELIRNNETVARYFKASSRLNDVMGEPRHIVSIYKKHELAHERYKRAVTLVLLTLRIAICCDKFEDCSRMVLAGLPLNECVRHNEQDCELSALMQACILGNEKITQLLINADADLNFKNADGDTALICAVTDGQTHIVDLLVSKKADVTVRNNDGATALSRAQLLAEDDHNYGRIVEILTE